LNCATMDDDVFFDAGEFHVVFMQFFGAQKKLAGACEGISQLE